MKSRIAKYFASGALALAAVMIPSIALAASSMTGSDVSLAKSEVHEGTLYAAGNNIVISGEIKGDLVCAGQTVVISGPVSGDILCAAQTLTISSAVAGNLRVIGQTVTINGTVGRNLNVIAQNVTIGSEAKVGGEAGIWAETVTIDAPISSNLYGAMTSLTLQSTVGGNVDVIVEDLIFGSDAKITGNLGYASAATFTVDPARVGGSIRRSDPPESSVKPETKGFDFGGWLLGRIYTWLSLLVIALPLVFIAPRAFRRLNKTLLEKPGQSLGWGFIAQMAWPIVGIIVFCTIIGITLAMLGLMLWVVLLLMTAAFAGIAIGHFVLSGAHWKADSLIWASIIGITIYVAATSLPILGFILSVVAFWWITGGLILSAKHLR
jgi:hypothetical protein